MSTLSLLRGDQVGVSPLPFWWRLLTDHPSPSTTLLFHCNRVVAGHAVIQGRTEPVTRAAPPGQGDRVARSWPEACGWCSCGPTWEQDWKPLHYPFPSPSFSQTDEHRDGREPWGRTRESGRPEKQQPIHFPKLPPKRRVTFII